MSLAPRPSYPGYQSSFLKTDVQQQGRIVIGCCLDQAHIQNILLQITREDLKGENAWGADTSRGKQVGDEIMGITEYDLVFCKRDAGRFKPSGRMMTLDVREAWLVDVFSAFNGITIDPDHVRQFFGAAPSSAPLDPILVQAYMHHKFRFVGISNQNQDFDKTKTRTATGIAAAIGGIITVRNTGTKNIGLGDMVVYTIPKRDEVRAGAERMHFGDLHRDKIVAQVEPFRHSDALGYLLKIREALDKEVLLANLPSIFDMTDAEGKGSSSLFATREFHAWEGGEITPAQHLLLDTWIRECIGERIIGVALSPARKGENFDIMLSKSHFNV